MDTKDKGRILDIYMSALDIRQHVAGFTEEAFLADKKTKDAVVFRICVLGEASNLISSHVRDKIQDVPWKQIIKARNRLIHGYDDIEYPTVWEMATLHNDALLESLEPIMEEIDPEGRRKNL